MPALLRDCVAGEPIGTHYHEWSSGKADVRYKYSLKPTPSHMTSWSTRTAQSQWTGLIGGTQCGRVQGLYTKSGAQGVTAPSLTMEVEAVSHAIQWLSSQRGAQITHSIILTDLMNPLRKIESGIGCPDWHTAMHSLRLQRFQSICCPGYAGVSGNGRTDRWASTADVTSVCCLAGQRCLEAWGAFWTWTGQSIIALISSRTEEWKKEATDSPAPEEGNDLCSTRQKHWHSF